MDTLISPITINPSSTPEGSTGDLCPSCSPVHHCGTSVLNKNYITLTDWGLLLLEQVVNSSGGCENRVNRWCGYLSGLREGLHLRHSRRSTVFMYGHIFKLVEDLHRIIIPLFLQLNSSSLYAVICLHAYFPQFRAVVLHNTAHNYNSTPNRWVFFVSQFPQRDNKVCFLHIISRVQYWNLGIYSSIVLKGNSEVLVL